MGSTTPSAIFLRYCIVRLLFVSFEGTWSGSEAAWISSQDEQFYLNDIRALPKRWVKVYL